MSLRIFSPNLWKGNLTFAAINIDSAQFSLKRLEDGRWLIPKPKLGGAGKPEGFDLNIDRIGLNHISLRLLTPKDTLAFKDIMMKGGIQVSGTTYSTQIDTLSFESSDKRFNLKAGQGKLTLSGSDLIFQDLTLKTDSMDVTMSGQYHMGDNPSAKAVLDMRRFNMPQFASFVRTRLNGNLSAVGDVEYNAKQLSGNLMLSGIFESRQFDTMNVQFQYIMIDSILIP